MAGDRSKQLAETLRRWFPQGFPCMWGLSLTNQQLSADLRNLLGNGSYPGLWAGPQHRKNFVRYFHTPDIWGAGDGRAWATSGKKAPVLQAVGASNAFHRLVSAWCNIIHYAEHLVDITSLEVPAPGSDVANRLLAAVRSTLMRRLRARPKHPMVIRFLFGGTPQSKTADFKARLKLILNSVSGMGTPDVRRQTHVHFATDYRGVAFRNPRFVGLPKTWNHSKIVAADGCRAITGGHNMNAEGSYTKFPVIHDLSVEVRGNGALLAHYFASSLWEKGEETGFLDGSAFDWDRGDFVAFGRPSPVSVGVDAAKGLAPGSDSIGERWGALGDDYAPADAVMGIGRWGDVRAYGVLGSGVQQRVEVGVDHGYHYCSDHVKRLLIREAQSSIRISQQDLVSPNKIVGYADSYHDTCFELGKRLHTARPVDIDVVLSSRYALDADGAPYSYGDSPREAAAKISAAAQAAGGVHDGNSCVVSPLTFCDVTGVRNHEDYIWPDAWRGFGGFVKGHVMQSHTWWKPTYGFGPGNHAKAFMIDDELVLIGSDNMYPSPLAEFSFIIEGRAAVDMFKQEYWTPLWDYSQRMGIMVGNRRVVAPPQVAPVVQPEALVRAV